LLITVYPLFFVNSTIIFRLGHPGQSAPPSDATEQTLNMNFRLLPRTPANNRCFRMLAREDIILSEVIENVRHSGHSVCLSIVITS